MSSRPSIFSQGASEQPSFVYSYETSPDVARHLEFNSMMEQSFNEVPIPQSIVPSPEIWTQSCERFDKDIEAMIAQQRKLLESKENLEPNSIMNRPSYEPSSIMRLPNLKTKGSQYSPSARNTGVQTFPSFMPEAFTQTPKVALQDSTSNTEQRKLFSSSTQCEETRHKSVGCQKAPRQHSAGLQTEPEEDRYYEMKELLYDYETKVQLLESDLAAEQDKNEMLCEEIQSTMAFLNEFRDVKQSSADLASLQKRHNEELTKKSKELTQVQQELEMIREKEAQSSVRAQQLEENMAKLKKLMAKKEGELHTFKKREKNRNTMGVQTDRDAVEVKLRRSLEKTKKELTEATMTREFSTANTQTTEVDIDQLMNEITQLRSKLKDSNRQKGDMERRVDDYVRQSHEFKGKLEELDKLKSSHSKLQGEVSSLKQKLETEKNLKKHIGNELSKTRDIAEEQQATTDKRFKKLKGELQTTKGTLLKLGDEISDMNAEKISLKLEVEQLRTDLNAAEKSIEAKQAENIYMKAKFEAGQTQIADLTLRNKKLQQEIFDSADVNKNLEHKLDYTNKQLSRASSEVDERVSDLQKSLMDTKEDAEELELENKSLKAALHSKSIKYFDSWVDEIESQIL